MRRQLREWLQEQEGKLLKRGEGRARDRAIARLTRGR